MKALDLFCGAGGVSKGLDDAGFTIIGVDINYQPRYPYVFIQKDIFKLPISFFKDFDFIWASPPCQRYTQMLNHGLVDRQKYPDYIACVRRLLNRIGKPYCIENVAHAPLISPLMLCGEMFKLRVIRHRFFETNFQIRQPKHKPHQGTCIRKQNDGGYYYRVYGHETGKREWKNAMKIQWMKTYELTQAIPPAYAEYIGKYVLQNNRI